MLDLIPETVEHFAMANPGIVHGALVVGGVVLAGALIIGGARLAMRKIGVINLNRPQFLRVKLAD